MKKIIHNLRQQPVHVRRMIAFATSIFVTGLIGLVWVSNLITLGISTPVDTAQLNKTPSPIVLLYGQAKDLIKLTGNQLAEVSSVFNFMQTSSTMDNYSNKKIIATSTDGSIGVSTTNNDLENTNVNSLTKEQ